MNGRMSAIGPKPTFDFALHMSAFGGKVDMLPTPVGSASDLKMAVVRTIRFT
jgi:hypothetical protein